MDTLDSTPFKRCSKCGTEHPPTTEFFPPSKKVKSGLESWCRACKNANHLTEYYKVKAQQSLKVDAKSKANYQRQLKRFAAHPELHEIKKKQGREYALEKRQAPDFNEKRRETRNLKRENERRAERRATDPVYQEHVRTQTLNYRHNNPEKYRLISRSNSAKRRARGAQELPISAIRDMMRWQKAKCWYCSTDISKSFHVEHRIPVSRGGTNDLGNMVLACPMCNMRKHDKTPAEWIGRLL